MSGIWGDSALLMPSKTIVNYNSAGGKIDGVPSTAAPPALTNGKLYASGALTATTYKELLAVTGPGVIDLCYAGAGDTTSRTIGLKVVIDGVTVFDAVSAALTDANSGIVAIGTKPAANNVASGTPRVFNSSLSVSVKSSLNESNLVTLVASYDTK